MSPAGRSLPTARIAAAAVFALVAFAANSVLCRVALAGAPPLILFIYAAAFSFAYLKLSIGAGALVLFGSVQVTMMLAGLRLGERPGIVQWVGIAAAFGGLVFLVLPGLSAPPLGAAAAGVVVLGEAVSARLVVSAAAILGGIALALTQRNGGGS